MQVIEATYRIVTPMFIGDAEQKATGVRPPSVKGALRFWWRSLNWGRALAETGNDTAEALRWLHKEEARLFGLAARTGTNGKQQGGQGVFLLRVTRQPQKLSPVVRGGAAGNTSGWPRNNTGSGYLGFGLFEAGSREKGNYHPPREDLQEDQDFALELCFRPRTDHDDLDSVRQALKVWGMLGGLGSRSRRGFGSVTLTKLDGVDQLGDAEIYRATLQTLVDDHRRVTELPPFTAFSRFARFCLLGEAGSNARQVHDTVGELYRQHRGQPSPLRGQVKIPFGLPLQGEDETNRRASPLLFHIHALADGKAQASALFLSAHFHPRYSAGNHVGYFTEVERFMEEHS